MDIQKVKKALERNNYMVNVFKTKEEATRYLQENIYETSVGLGDSLTLDALDLSNKLSIRNSVYDPAKTNSDYEFVEMARKSTQTDIYITSVNAITEDGILVNLDCTGNRIAGSSFGAKKVYYVVGTNKIVSTLDEAIWRVRNVAAPKNAKRHGYKTPCAIKGDKCYDCNSEERICNGMFIEMKKCHDTDKEIVLICDNLGL